MRIGTLVVRLYKDVNAIPTQYDDSHKSFRLSDKSRKELLDVAIIHQPSNPSQQNWKYRRGPTYKIELSVLDLQL